MSRCFISNLTLKNYRCFQKLELSFHPKLTVFVAPNGGGKTAVLDGIAVALRLFVDTIEGRTHSKGFSARDIRLVLNPYSKMEPVTPVRLEASAMFLGSDISWARERQSEAASWTQEKGDLKKVASQLVQKHQEWAQSKGAEAPLFPLVSYYGTGRLWSTSKLTEGKKRARRPPMQDIAATPIAFLRLPTTSTSSIGSGAFRMKQRGALMSHPTSRYAP